MLIAVKQSAATIKGIPEACYSACCQGGWWESEVFLLVRADLETPMDPGGRRGRRGGEKVEWGRGGWGRAWNGYIRSRKGMMFLYPYLLRAKSNPMLV